MSILFLFLTISLCSITQAGQNIRTLIPEKKIKQNKPTASTVFSTVNSVREPRGNFKNSLENINQLIKSGQGDLAFGLLKPYVTRKYLPAVVFAADMLAEGLGGVEKDSEEAFNLYAQSLQARRPQRTHVAQRVLELSLFGFGDKEVIGAAKGKLDQHDVVAMYHDLTYDLYQTENEKSDNSKKLMNLYCRFNNIRKIRDSQSPHIASLCHMQMAHIISMQNKKRLLNVSHVPMEKNTCDQMLFHLDELAAGLENSKMAIYDCDLLKKQIGNNLFALFQNYCDEANEDKAIKKAVDFGSPPASFFYAQHLFEQGQENEAQKFWDQARSCSCENHMKLLSEWYCICEESKCEGDYLSKFERCILLIEKLKSIDESKALHEKLKNCEDCLGNTCLCGECFKVIGNIESIESFKNSLNKKLLDVFFDIKNPTLEQVKEVNKRCTSQIKELCNITKEPQGEDIIRKIETFAQFNNQAKITLAQLYFLNKDFELALSQYSEIANNEEIVKDKRVFACRKIVELGIFQGNSLAICEALGTLSSLKQDLSKNQKKNLQSIPTEVCDFAAKRPINEKRGLYEKLTEFFPDNIQLLYRLANAQEDNGKQEEYLKKALDVRAKTGEDVKFKEKSEVRYAGMISDDKAKEILKKYDTPRSINWFLGIINRQLKSALPTSKRKELLEAEKKEYLKKLAKAYEKYPKNCHVLYAEMHRMQADDSLSHDSIIACIERVIEAYREKLKNENKYSQNKIKKIKTIIGQCLYNQAMLFLHQQLFKEPSSTLQNDEKMNLGCLSSNDMDKAVRGLSVSYLHGYENAATVLSNIYVYFKKERELKKLAQLALKTGVYEDKLFDNYFSFLRPIEESKEEFDLLNDICKTRNTLRFLDALADFYMNGRGGKFDLIKAYNLSVRHFNVVNHLLDGKSNDILNILTESKERIEICSRSRRNFFLLSKKELEDLDKTFSSPSEFLSMHNVIEGCFAVNRFFEYLLSISSDCRPSNSKEYEKRLLENCLKNYNFICEKGSAFEWISLRAKYGIALLQDKIKEKEKHLKKIIKKKERYPHLVVIAQSFYQLARIQEKKNDMPSAQAYYREATDMEYAPAISAMALHCSDSEKCWKYYENALKLDPSELAASFQLGVFKEDEKKYTEACDLFKNAAMHHPYNPDVCSNYARCLLFGIGNPRGLTLAEQYYGYAEKASVLFYSKNTKIRKQYSVHKKLCSYLNREKLYSNEKEQEEINAFIQEVNGELYQHIQPLVCELKGRLSEEKDDFESAMKEYGACAQLNPYGALAKARLQAKQCIKDKSIIDQGQIKKMIEDLEEAKKMESSSCDGYAIDANKYIQYLKQNADCSHKEPEDEKMSCEEKKKREEDEERKRRKRLKKKKKQAIDNPV